MTVCSWRPSRSCIHSIRKSANSAPQFHFPSSINRPPTFRTTRFKEMEEIERKEEAMNNVSKHSQIGKIPGKEGSGEMTPDKLIRPLSSCDSGYKSANLIADSPDASKSLRGRGSGSIVKRKSITLADSLESGKLESPVRHVKIEKRKLIFSPNKIVIDLDTSEELELIGQSEKESEPLDEIDEIFEPLTCSTPTKEVKSFLNEIIERGHFLESDGEETDFDFAPLSDSDREEGNWNDDADQKIIDILNTGMIEDSDEEEDEESFLNMRFSDYVEEYAKKLQKHFATSS